MDATGAAGGDIERLFLGPTSCFNFDFVTFENSELPGEDPVLSGECAPPAIFLINS